MESEVSFKMNFKNSMIIQCLRKYYHNLLPFFNIYNIELFPNRK